MGPSVEDTCSSLVASKFGGIDPWLDEEKGWPLCIEVGCGRRKSFLCQVDVRGLPEKMK